MEKTSIYCKEKLENNGFRITPQRLSIFSFLVESKSHPSAEDVYQQVKKEFPNISFDTVNRTLLSLLEKGLIKLIESGYGPRRFDANLKPHYHFRCLHCKRIIDFQSKEYDNVNVPEKLKKKYKIIKQEIILTGICPECISKQKRMKLEK